MSEKVRVVKSPFPYGIEKLPSSRPYGYMTVSIMLPNGIMITNPDQFEDHDVDIEEYNDDGVE